MSENITLKDFFQNWLDNVLALNIKPTSLQCYLSYYKRHILPSLGSIPVQELTPAKLDSWIRNLQKGGYSKNTISQLHALDYAVYPAELISSNPANYIKVPKKAPTNIIKRHIITPDKLKTLLEKYPFGSPYYIPILILYHTGMRIGEMCGLTWDNVNFDEKISRLKSSLFISAVRAIFLRR